ncbi:MULTISPECIES: hypothetical protein [unclassified Halomonas]|uniref:hypothetical protein n=1 Tax=unclassified Halomonas TaxID=2609666 RepID=UPI004033F663
MKKNIILAALLSSLIAGCANTANHSNSNSSYQASDSSPSVTNVRIEIDENQIEEAQAAVRGALKDPDSANFRDVHGISVAEDGPLIAVCGEVNAKNSYGGYIGYNRFAYTADRVYLWQKTRRMNVDNSIVEFTCDL